MDVPRISIDELKRIIENNEPAAIADVRQPAAFASSKLKIPGAIHIDPDNDSEIEAYSKEHTKDERIVFY